MSFVFTVKLQLDCDADIVSRIQAGDIYQHTILKWVLPILPKQGEPLDCTPGMSASGKAHYSALVM